MIKNIKDYVTTTPENTNWSVLQSMMSSHIFDIIKPRIISPDANGLNYTNTLLALDGVSNQTMVQIEDSEFAHGEDYGEGINGGWGPNQYDDYDPDWRPSLDKTYLIIDCDTKQELEGDLTMNDWSTLRIRIGKCVKLDGANKWYFVNKNCVNTPAQLESLCAGNPNADYSTLEICVPVKIGTEYHTNLNGVVNADSTVIKKYDEDVVINDHYWVAELDDIDYNTKSYIDNPDKLMNWSVFNSVLQNNPITTDILDATIVSSKMDDTTLKFSDSTGCLTVSTEPLGNYDNFYIASEPIEVSDCFVWGTGDMYGTTNWKPDLNKTYFSIDYVNYLVDDTRWVVDKDTFIICPLKVLQNSNTYYFVNYDCKNTIGDLENLYSNTESDTDYSSFKLCTKTNFANNVLKTNTYMAIKRLDEKYGDVSFPTTSLLVFELS